MTKSEKKENDRKGETERKESGRERGRKKTGTGRKPMERNKSDRQGKRQSMESRKDG